MGFNFTNVISGVSKAGTSYFDDKTQERTKERDKIEGELFTSMSSIHSQAANVKETRRQKDKALKQIMRDFKSKDSTLDQGQLEYIAQLGTDRLSALMATASSPALLNSGRTLSDVITLMDDPAELDNTVDLIDRVNGAIVPMQLDTSAYYSSTDILSNSDVDAMADRIGKQFQNITGMTPAKAKGYAQRNLAEVQERSYSIEYVGEDARSKNDFERAALSKTLLELQGASASVKVSDELSESLLVEMEAVRESYANSGEHARQFNIDNKIELEAGQALQPSRQIAGFEASFRSKAVYTDTVIRLLDKTVKTAMENKELKEPYLAAIEKSFPGIYGGEAGSDTSKLSNGKLYWATGIKDGEPHLRLVSGRKLKIMQQAADGKGITGGKIPGDQHPPEFKEGKDTPKEGKDTPKKVKDLPITYNETGVETDIDTLVRQKPDIDATIQAIEDRLADMDEEEELISYKIEKYTDEGDTSLVVEFEEQLTKLKSDRVASRKTRDEYAQQSAMAGEEMAKRGIRVEPVPEKEGLMSRSSVPTSQWASQNKESMKVLSMFRDRADRAIKSGDTGRITSLLAKFTELAADEGGNYNWHSRQTSELRSIINQLESANTTDGV